MFEKVVHSLPTTAKVVEQLLARFGADNVRKIERLTPNVYRGFTLDGTLILATITKDGDLIVREEEMLA